MSQQKSKKEFIQVPISELKLSSWDIRLRPEDPDEFEQLKKSIDANGMIHLINVVRMKNGDLVVVTGRRRLKAIQELGWKSVEVEVKYENLTESELRRIIISENVDRRDLADMEKGYGIIGQYEAAGYTAEQAYHGAKSIDNWFHNNVGKTWEDLISREQGSLLPKAGFKANGLRYDPKFVDICRHAGYSPKYQYQLMEIVMELAPEVLIHAEQKGLNYRKKLLLTHTKLRAHPVLQKAIIDKIHDVNDLEASTKVGYYLRGLDEGWIRQSGNRYTIDTLEAKANLEVKNTDPSSQYLNIMGASSKLIYALTGRALTKGEFEYNLDTIDNTDEWVYGIVKSAGADTRELNTMHRQLVVLKKALNNTLKIMDAEYDVLSKKKEMIGR